jgi:hypothetical protein
MESGGGGGGVSRPVVSDVFAFRGELLGVVLEREEQRTLAELASAIPAPPWLDQDPDDVLKQAIETFLDAVQRNPRRWILILHPVEGTPEEIREKVEHIREGIVRLATDLLGVGLAVRQSSTDIDLDLVSRMLVGNAEEGARLMLQRPDDYPRERLLGFVDWMTRIIPRAAPYPVSLQRTLAELGPEDPIRILIAERAGNKASGNGLL